MRIVLFTLILVFIQPVQAMEILKEKTAQSTPARADISGLYETQKDNGSLVPLEDGQSCDPPNELEGDMCVQPYTSTDQLGIYKQDDGTLLFFANLFFFNGHSCSVGGEAVKTETGWLFEEMDAADAPDESFDDCQLDITVEKNEIVLNAREEASCRFYCGARGDLSNARFALSSKRTDIEMTEERLRCMGWFEGAENCDQYNEEGAP